MKVICRNNNESMHITTGKTYDVIGYYYTTHKSGPIKFTKVGVDINDIYMIEAYVIISDIGISINGGKNLFYTNSEYRNVIIDNILN